MASTFSFFVGHHLSTIEGGMICTDDENLYEQLMMVRIHGWSRNLPSEKQKELQEEYNIDNFYNKYTFYELAYNARPTEINGFLGNEQINYIEEIIQKREDNFKKINAIISANPDLIKLDISNLTKISNFGIPLIFQNEILFHKYLKKFEEDGIEVRPIISGNTAEQPFFKKNFLEGENFYPNAELIHKQGFYCGNNPELTEEELNRIIHLIKHE